MQRQEVINRTVTRTLDHVFLYWDTNKQSETPEMEVKVRFSDYDEDGNHIAEVGTLEVLTEEEAEPILDMVEKMVLAVYAARQEAAKQKPAEEQTESEKELAAFSAIEVEK